MSSILHKIGPGVKPTLESMSAHPMVVGSMLVLLLAMLYRHTVLCYGSRRSSVLAIMLFVVLLFSYPARNDAEIAASPLMSTALAVVFMEFLVITYARQYSPFLAYNTGTLIALLTLFHPGYLLLLLVQILRARRLMLHTPHHVSAFLLGLLMTPMVVLLLVVPPNPIAIYEAISAFFSQLLMISYPQVGTPIYFIGVAVILFAISVQAYFTQQRSISRYRWMLILHLMTLWSLVILFTLYSSHMGYLIAALFFSCSAAHYLLSQSSSSRLFKSALFLGGGLCVLGRFIII